MERDLLATEVMKTFENLNSENILNKLNLSFKGENTILMLLNEYGGISTPGKLCERIDFTAARLSAIIKSMEGKGLIEKIQNPEDKRSTIVAMTSQGYEQFMRLKEEIVINALTIIEKLGEDDVVEFLRIIRKLIDISNQPTAE